MGSAFPPCLSPERGPAGQGRERELAGLRPPPPRGRRPRRLSPLSRPRHPRVWDTTAHAGGGGWVTHGPGRRRVNTPCAAPGRPGAEDADPAESLQTAAAPTSASGLSISPGAPLPRTQSPKNQRGCFCPSLRAPLRQHSSQKALRSSVSAALQAACSCLGPPLVDEHMRAHTQAAPVKIYTACGRVL